MGYTGPAQPTDIDGLQVDSTVVSSIPTPNPTVPAGTNLCYAGQSAANVGVNTSGANVANQGVGTLSIPNATASGTKIVVPNTLIKAGSMVFLQLIDVAGTITEVCCNPADHVAGTSFSVKVITSGATVGAVDCWYQIVN